MLIFGGVGCGWSHDGENVSWSCGREQLRRGQGGNGDEEMVMEKQWEGSW